MDTKIFIVEDNIPFAIDLEMHLKSWGYQVIGMSNNSEEAIAIIQQERPNLILMDINITGAYNGIEVAEYLKSLEIPIIYMTGLIDEHIFQQAQNTTGISYLIKPFDMLTLKGTIGFYFERQKDTLNNSNPTNSFENELFVRKNKELIRIDTAKIDWINTNGNYCIISSENKKFVVKKSMKQLLSLLPPDEFIKIHKSYSVRIKAVKGVFLSKNKVRIGGDLLPVGRNYKNKFLNLIKHIN